MISPLQKTLVACFGLAFAADAAIAGPDDAFDAGHVQRAMAVGDVYDRAAAPGSSFSPAASAFAWFLDAYWRPVPVADGRGRRPEAKADAVAERIQWLARLATEPTLSEPIAGNADPLAVLTALVLDRNRREREGLHSTHTQGPLAAVGTDEAIKYFLDEWAPGAYGGPSAIVGRKPEAEQVALERGLKEDAARNVLVGLGAILGLVLVAAVGGITLGHGGPSPARRSPAEVDSHGPGTNG